MPARVQKDLLLFLAVKYGVEICSKTPVSSRTESILAEEVWESLSIIRKNGLYPFSFHSPPLNHLWIVERAHPQQEDLAVTSL